MTQKKSYECTRPLNNKFLRVQINKVIQIKDCTIVATISLHRPEGNVVQSSVNGLFDQAI